MKTSSPVFQLLLMMVALSPPPSEEETYMKEEEAKPQCDGCEHRECNNTDGWCYMFERPLRGCALNRKGR